MLVVTSYPGQSPRFVQADEYLCKQLRKNPWKIPHVREAHEVERQLNRPMGDEELRLELERRTNEDYGSW